MGVLSSGVFLVSHRTARRMGIGEALAMFGTMVIVLSGSVAIMGVLLFVVEVALRFYL